MNNMNVYRPFPFAIWLNTDVLYKAMPTNFGSTLANVSLKGARGALSGLTGSISRGLLGNTNVVVKEARQGNATNSQELHKDAAAMHALQGTGVAPTLHGYQHGTGTFGNGRHYVAEDVSSNMDNVGVMSGWHGTSTHRAAMGNLAHSAFSALGAMHNAGIAHGDLMNKPEHIFMDTDMMGSQDHANNVASGNHGVKFIDFGNAVHRDDASFPVSQGSPRTFEGTRQSDIKGVAGTLLSLSGSKQNAQGKWIHPPGSDDFHKMLEDVHSGASSATASQLASAFARLNKIRNKPSAPTNVSAPQLNVSSQAPAQRATYGGRQRLDSPAVQASIPSTPQQPAPARATYGGRQRLDRL